MASQLRGISASSIEKACKGTAFFLYTQDFTLKKINKLLNLLILLGINCYM